MPYRNSPPLRAGARGTLAVLLYLTCAGAAPVQPSDTPRVGIADTGTDEASPVPGVRTLPPGFSLRDAPTPPRQTENSTAWTDFMSFFALILAAFGAVGSTMALYQSSMLTMQIRRLEKAVSAGRKAADARAAQTSEALTIAETHSKAALQQAAATGKAAEAALAAQRAWIEIAAGVTTPLTIDAQGVHFSIGWNIRNLGHSPATLVTVNVQVVPNIFGKYGLKEAVEEARKACDADRQKAGGYTVFPQQVAPGRDTAVTIPRREFDAAVAAMQKTMNGTPIGIAICASYRFWGGAGETIVTFMLSRVQSGNANAIGLTLPKIPQEELRLIQQSMHQSAR